MTKMTKTYRSKKVNSDEIRFSKHAQGKLAEFAISEDVARKIIKDAIPYPIPNLPTQQRYCIRGIALVVDWSKMVCVTAYRDRVITPIRADQKERGIQIKRGGGKTSIPALHNAEPQELPEEIQTRKD